MKEILKIVMTLGIAVVLSSCSTIQIDICPDGSEQQDCVNKKKKGDSQDDMERMDYHLQKKWLQSA